MLNSIADNVWAFLMILLGSAVAIVAAHMGNKDLLAFAGVVAGYGAGIFHGKSDKPDKPATP